MRNDLPLVSVVVASYNNGKYLEQCLESAINQTYPNIEIVIVDDCSTDNSCDLIDQVVKKYVHKNIIVVFNEKNLGACNSLNNAIMSHTNGALIKLLDSDDYLAENCISILVDAIIKTPNKMYSLIYGKAQSFQLNKDNVAVFSAIRGFKTDHEGLLFGYSNGIPAPSAMFKRDHFIEVGGFKEGMQIGDLYLWLKLTINYAPIFVNSIVSFYQEGSNVESLSKNHPKMSVALVSIISEFLALRKDLDYNLAEQFFDKIHHEHYYFIIYSLENYLKKDKQKAIRLYFKHFFMLLAKRSKYVFIFWLKLFK